MPQNQENLSGKMTVLSMVNGMIGGLILLLPVMALETGWLLTLIILIVTGVMSYFSCYLCLIHTSNEPDLDVAIQKHFWNSKKVKIFYEVCIWLNLMLILTLYFQLIVYQWIGLAPPHHYTNLNAFINAAVLLGVVFIIKYCDFGANLMAYGIISIFSYLVFITWVAASQDTSNKQVQFKAFGTNGIQLAAALGQAYAIQCFFIPILKKNNKTQQHKRYVALSFVLGGLAYTYISLMGSYGILYREFLDYSDSQRTIEGYFGMNNWQVNVIEVIYLVHLYSVFPEYLLIGKLRFFSIFNLEATESRSINKKECFYIVIVILYCFMMAVNRISLREIIDINGAVLGFFFIYFFPIALHIKCKYFQPKSQTRQLTKKEDENYAEMNEENQANKEPNLEQKQKPDQIKQIEMKEKIQQNKQSPQNTSQKKAIEKGSKNESQPTAFEFQVQKEIISQCDCKNKPYSKREKVLELAGMSIMLLLGGFTLFDGIAQLFRN